VVRLARLHQWPRCSAQGGDTMGDRWRLRRARRGGGVLTGDGRWWCGGENGPTQWRSKAVMELQWPGRALTSPAVGGEDGGGEATSRRGG
jgi:hypothetical protein